MSQQKKTFRIYVNGEKIHESMPTTEEVLTTDMILDRVADAEAVLLPVDGRGNVVDHRFTWQITDDGPEPKTQSFADWGECRKAVSGVGKYSEVQSAGDANVNADDNDEWYVLDDTKALDVDDAAVIVAHINYDHSPKRASPLEQLERLQKRLDESRLRAKQTRLQRREWHELRRLANIPPSRADRTTAKQREQRTRLRRYLQRSQKRARQIRQKRREWHNRRVLETPVTHKSATTEAALREQRRRLRNRLEENQRRCREVRQLRRQSHEARRLEQAAAILAATEAEAKLRTRREQLRKRLEENRQRTREVRLKRRESHDLRLIEQAAADWAKAKMAAAHQMRRELVEKRLEQNHKRTREIRIRRRQLHNQRQNMTSSVKIITYGPTTRAVEKLRRVPAEQSKPVPAGRSEELPKEVQFRSPANRTSQQYSYINRTSRTSSELKGIVSRTPESGIRPTIDFDKWEEAIRTGPRSSDIHRRVLRIYLDSIQERGAEAVREFQDELNEQASPADQVELCRYDAGRARFQLQLVIGQKERFRFEFSFNPCGRRARA